MSELLFHRSESIICGLYSDTGITVTSTDLKKPEQLLKLIKRERTKCKGENGNRDACAEVNCPLLLYQQRLEARIE